MGRLYSSMAASHPIRPFPASLRSRVISPPCPIIVPTIPTTMVKYSEFIDLWLKAFSSRKKEPTLIAGQHFWVENKADTSTLQAKCSDLRAQIVAQKAKAMAMWAGFTRPPQPRPAPPTADCKSGRPSSNASAAMSGSISDSDSSRPLSGPSSTASSSPGNVRAQPHAQNKLQSAISDLEADINMYLTKKEKRGLSAQEATELNDAQSQVEIARKRLKRKLVDQQASQRFRDKKKVARLASADQSLDQPAADVIRVGRPRIEDSNPDLLETIVSLVTNEASAHSRRRQEQLNACRTLADLTKELNTLGFTISQSAVYLRLLPRNMATQEGRRHVKTVPVKLMRPTYDLRKKHQDSRFAMGTVRYLKELAVLMGERCVFYLSQDDKARVPIGLAAANKQTHLMMHIQYRIILPDHDWVVAEKHKLIPSVYAALKIDAKSVTYSGPTYIAIRSAKHDSSNAITHAKDFETLMDLEEFAQFGRMSDRQAKPILIVTVDGGPDENPRYPKVLRSWARAFKAYDLDAVFVATHAPHQSAFNPVERRMAPLSRALAGVILKHDTCGSHLNGSGKTIDAELERRNFAEAGSALAQLWRELETIDSYPIVSNYIHPSEMRDLDELDDMWISAHVRQSQYLLQIVRCQNKQCCSSFRTNLCKILPERFLPPPLRFVKGDDGVVVAQEDEQGGAFGSLAERLVLDSVAPSTAFSKLPFDYHCPSLHSELGRRVCRHCRVYFASIAAKARHVRWCNTASVDNSITDEADDLVMLPIVSGDCNPPMPIFDPENDPYAVRFADPNTTNDDDDEIEY